MESNNLILFIKNKLLKKPINLRSIKNSTDTYESVIRLFIKFKKERNWFDYEICSVFNYFMKHNNHIIMYHSSDQNNSLLFIKLSGKYYYYLIPYIEVNEKLEKIKKRNFIAYYV